MSCVFFFELVRQVVDLRVTLVLELLIKEKTIQIEPNKMQGTKYLATLNRIGSTHRGVVVGWYEVPGFILSLKYEPRC